MVVEGFLVHIFNMFFSASFGLETLPGNFIFEILYKPFLGETTSNFRQ